MYGAYGVEPLRAGDPGVFGGYRALGRIDGAEAGRELGLGVPVRRYVARAAGGERTVVVSTAPPEYAEDAGCGQRFAAEAEEARRLAYGPGGDGLEYVAEVFPGGNGEPAWYASPFAPALPLPGALAAWGTALGAAAVRALGMALAGTLAGLHGQGVAHAGLTPGTVLLGAGRPFLSGFGSVRALAPAGAERSEVPGLPYRWPAPEQRAGGRPRPAGDVYALGAVLAYAATGRLGAGAGALAGGPAEPLRGIVGSCLASDPADRPPAATVGEWLRALPAPGGPSPAAALPATVLDVGAAASEAVRLPGRVVAALARQSADALNAPLPATAWGPPPGRGAPAAHHPATAVSRLED